MLNKIAPVAHDATNHSRPPIDAETAVRVAAILHALATPSRLMILGRLRDGHATVIELAEHAGLEQSAASHQLRILRDLGLVTCERDGRNMVYDLHNDHVLELIDQAVHHTTHVRLGITRREKQSGPRVK